MDTRSAPHLEQLLGADLTGVDLCTLQALAGELHALAGRLLGRRDQVLAELAARGGGQVQTSSGSDGPARYQSVAGWWRDTATLTGQQAGRDVRRAAILRDLPVLAAAVVAGELAPEQAAVLCRLHGQIPHQALLASQTQLVQVARDLNPDALSRFVRHLIATHCEPALDREQAHAHERRYLQLSTEPDGTVRGRFVLTAEDAESVLTVLEPLARRQGVQDQRSAGQRRADALVEVFTGAAAWMSLPDAGGQRVQVTYVLNASWCAGEQPLSLPEQLHHHRTHPSGLQQHPPTGAWTGPQTRPRIEALLCDARISRLLLDNQSQIVALHSLTDQITTAQRRAVSARDRTCIAKGCTRPPAFCDVHHLDHRTHGGTTTVTNLALLCRRHHVQLHRGTLGHHDLHTPWLPNPEPEPAPHDPWDTHSPPLVA